MSDIFDRAQENEQIERDEAIARALAASKAPGRLTCISCGDPIEPERLAVHPNAQRCLGCQTEAERRGYLGRGA